MLFADIIAELKERFRAELEQPDGEWRLVTDTEIAAMITELKLDVPPAQCNKKHLTDDDIERWATETEISVETLFDAIAMYLAQGFHVGTLPFGFCDAIINELEVFTLRDDSTYAAHAKNGPRQGPSKLLWNIYLAFDAGEYRRSGDDRNPVTAFTRRAVEEIITQNAEFHYPDDGL